ncbi:glutamine synthetase family protein, partial [Acidobacteriota bacterium]
MSKEEVLRKAKDSEIRFLRLQFTDIMGSIKNVEVPENQFEKALDGQVLFDGSSIEGFSRIEESDMLLKPDLSSFSVFPWNNGTGKVGRLICDIHNPDGTPFEGCPRLTLKKVVQEASEMGFTACVGPEAEFFLFHRDENGNATNRTHDAGGYFDMTPVDQGEEARRAIVNALEAMGFQVEASHHEVAPGQHEIDFQYADAIRTADNIATFKFLVRKVARDFGLHATFMPKPIYGINGSGMHCHISLFEKEQNAFFDSNGSHKLSKMARYFIG